MSSSFPASSSIRSFRRATVPMLPNLDRDTVLTMPVAAQSLKPVSWNCRHVLQLPGIVQHPELPPCNCSNVAESATLLTVKQLLGLPAAEGSYQDRKSVA